MDQSGLLETKLGQQKLFLLWLFRRLVDRIEQSLIYRLYYIVFEDGRPKMAGSQEWLFHKIIGQALVEHNTAETGVHYAYG